jgi:cytochrome P450
MHVEDHEWNIKMTNSEHHENWDLAGSWEPVRTGDEVAIAQAYEAARGRCPVQRVTLPGGANFWAVIARDEVAEVLNQPGVFSSAIANFGTAPRIPLELDPPVHAGYRRMLNRLINQSVATTLEPEIRRYVVEALVPFIANGGGNLVPLATEIPLRVLCRLLGAPEEDWKVILETQAKLVPADSLNIKEGAAAARFALLKPVTDYALSLIARSKAQPGDDLVSRLLVTTLEDRVLTEDEVYRIVVLLLLAGHETTKSAIAGSTFLLTRHREVQEKLRADPGLIAQAVEECLRLHAPVQGLNRVAARDVEIAGVAIKKGEHVVPVYGAANLDGSAFESPALFSLDRKPNHHFTFGHGIHTCIGAPIARLEIRIFLEELLSRTSTVELNDIVERRVNWPEVAFQHLNIEVVPTPRKVDERVPR